MNERSRIAFQTPNPEKDLLLKGMLMGPHPAVSCKKLLDLLIEEGSLDDAVKVHCAFAEKHREDLKCGQTLARACAAAGNAAGAVRVYADLIRRFPAEYINYKELEKLYVRIGQPRRAIALYKELKPTHPLKRKSYKRLTGIYWWLGDIPRAISSLRKEIDEYGLTPKLSRELGKFYLLSKRYIRAIESFQNALAGDKGDRETRVWLGVALMENGNYELAEYEFAELLREKPGNYQSLIHMAELRIRENKLTEARDLLEELDRRYPDNSRVMLCRAEIDFLEGRFKEAAQRGEAALAQTPFYYIWEQVRCHRLLKHAYRALHEVKREKLHREMQEALKKCRDVFSGLIRVAELKIGSGRLDEGKEILERILDLYPGNSRARVALAELFLREKNDRKAIEVGEGVLKDASPRFTVDLVRAHAVLSRAHSRLGAREKAAYHRRQRAALRVKG
jgi:tetratricopeptide (TPR) repeat protein